MVLQVVAPRKEREGVVKGRELAHELYRELAHELCLRTERERGCAGTEGETTRHMGGRNDTGGKKNLHHKDLGLRLLTNLLSFCQDTKENDKTNANTYLELVGHVLAEQKKPTIEAKETY
jgi:hypothetical protein